MAEFLAWVFGIILVIVLITGIFDAGTKYEEWQRTAPCSEWAMKETRYVPARCLNYFTASSSAILQ